MRRYVLGLGFVVASLGVSACKGSSGGNIIQNLLCGSGDARGKMTMGLNLDFLKGFLGLKSGENLQDQGVTDDAVKGFLNDTLNAGHIDSSLLNVASVESVGNDNHDQVRFLSLGGTFGNGFGMATSLIKQGLSSLSLSEGRGKAFKFFNESFGVAAATLIEENDRHVWREHKDVFTDETLAAADTDWMLAEAFHPKQWAYSQTNYDEAKTLFKGMRDTYLQAHPDEAQAPVIVAVLDTGVDLDHPDLKDVLTKETYDATNGGAGVQDENGHGTHCAGIIAAQKKSDKSPLGVANIIDNANVRIMPIKVLGKSGGGGFQEIEKGIRFAMKNGAKVISMSLGGGMDFNSLGGAEALENGVIKEAIDQGIIVVIAAGNESCPLGGECKDKGGSLIPRTFKEYTVLPCAYNASICVGATDADEKLASYSNYSSKKTGTAYRTKVDVNAPGTEIYSTWPRSLNPDGYRSISGTSMATPYVAGIAALVKAVHPEYGQENFRVLIKKSQAYPEEIKAKSEEGRVDLYTVAKLLKEGVAADVPAPAPKPVDAPTSASGDSGSVGSLLEAACKKM